MEWVANYYKLPIKSWCKDIEDGAFDQAANLAKHPVAFRHIALMPDAHLGYGVPIGGVFASKEAVIPNAVGLDIGCGMRFVQTDIKADSIFEDELNQIIAHIKDHIPVGFKWRKNPIGDILDWGSYPDQVDLVRQEMIDQRPQRQLGTLGGGNHFIELQKDDLGYLCVMIHSGSRNIGKKIGEHYHKQAANLNRKYHSNIPATELAFLPEDTELFEEYWAAMNFALDFAKKSRQIMMDEVINCIGLVFKAFTFYDHLDVHHNYASLENHFGKNVIVHRKGATSAKKGEYGIIPGSMGSASYIVQGKGNPESFMSCSHGAGRKMGRKQASRELTEKEANQAMEGVKFSGWGKDRKGNTDLGEAPQAYKNISEVMEAQEDLVDVIKELHPIGVIKG